MLLLGFIGVFSLRKRRIWTFAWSRSIGLSLERRIRHETCDFTLTKRNPLTVECRVQISRSGMSTSISLVSLWNVNRPSFCQLAKLFPQALGNWQNYGDIGASTACISFSVFKTCQTGPIWFQMSICDHNNVGLSTACRFQAEHLYVHIPKPETITDRIHSPETAKQNSLKQPKNPTKCKVSCIQILFYNTLKLSRFIS